MFFSFVFRTQQHPKKHNNNNNQNDVSL